MRLWCECGRRLWAYAGWSGALLTVQFRDYPLGQSCVGRPRRTCPGCGERLTILTLRRVRPSPAPGVGCGKAERG